MGRFAAFEENRTKGGWADARKAALVQAGGGPVLAHRRAEVAQWDGFRPSAIRTRSSALTDAAKVVAQVSRSSGVAAAKSAARS